MEWKASPNWSLTRCLTSCSFFHKHRRFPLCQMHGQCCTQSHRKFLGEIFVCVTIWIYHWSSCRNTSWLFYLSISFRWQIMVFTAFPVSYPMLTISSDMLISACGDWLYTMRALSSWQWWKIVAVCLPPQWMIRQVSLRWSFRLFSMLFNFNLHLLYNKHHHEHHQYTWGRQHFA